MSNQYMNIGEETFTFVHNAQISFGFDLPKKNTRGDIVEANIAVDILKNFANDRGRDRRTEIFCHQESRLCSGEFFYDSRFAALQTNKYTLVNDHFTQLLFSNGIANTEYIDGLELRTELPVTLLGTESLQNMNIRNEAHFVIADDIKLKKMPVLKLKTEKQLNNQCR